MPEFSGWKFETTEFSDNEIAACTTWMLPHRDFHGLWESLHYENEIKSDLLSYCQTAMYIAGKKVDQKMVSWNKVILLHGPPGTGKTSLAQVNYFKNYIFFNLPGP